MVIGELVPEFAINPSTGAIMTAKPLDREKISGYLLTITARDHGHPPMSDTTDVEITVADVNDNAPVFNAAAYHANIIEDALIGTSVLSVMATDADQGLNSRVRYILEGQFPISSQSFIAFNLVEFTFFLNEWLIYLINSLILDNSIYFLSC